MDQEMDERSFFHPFLSRPLFFFFLNKEEGGERATLGISGKNHCHKHSMKSDDEEKADCVFYKQTLKTPRLSFEYPIKTSHEIEKAGFI